MNNAKLAVMLFALGGCMISEEQFKPDQPSSPTPAAPTKVPGMAARKPPQVVIQTQACTLGATQDFGVGFEPSIGGTDDGFAIAYLERWGGDSIARMVDKDGGSTSPLMILPAGVGDEGPYVAGASGKQYVVVSNASSQYQTSNLFVMDQNGNTVSSVLNQVIFPIQVVTVGSALQLVWYAGESADCKSSLAIGAFGAKGTQIYCHPKDAEEDLITAFAASGDTFVTGLTVLADADHNVPAMASVVIGSLAQRTSARTDLRTSTDSRRSFYVASVATMSSGFAVLWQQRDYPKPDALPVIHGYLTFLDAAGGFKGTVGVPPLVQLVSNGSVLGGIAFDETAKKISFYLLDGRGQAIGNVQELTTKDKVHYVSWPSLAASGRNFGIVWAEDTKPDMTLKFAPIGCD